MPNFNTNDICFKCKYYQNNDIFWQKLSQQWWQIFFSQIYLFCFYEWQLIMKIFVKNKNNLKMKIVRTVPIYKGPDQARFFFLKDDQARLV
jgi:hypothetical protein